MFPNSSKPKPPKPRVLTKQRMWWPPCKSIEMVNQLRRTLLKIFMIMYLRLMGQFTRVWLGARIKFRIRLLGMGKSGSLLLTLIVRSLVLLMMRRIRIRSKIARRFRAWRRKEMNQRRKLKPTAITKTNNNNNKNKTNKNRSQNRQKNPKAQQRAKARKVRERKTNKQVSWSEPKWQTSNWPTTHSLKQNLLKIAKSLVLKPILVMIND